MRRKLPRIFLTPGEPAGIGPDLAVLIAQQRLPAQLVAVADPRLLESRARQRRRRLGLSVFQAGSPAMPHRPGHLSVLPVSLCAPVQAGVLNPANAPYVLNSLRAATRACRQGKSSALVTGPVHKGVINAAGFAFTGHTEFLAELTGTK
ncbi:MAG: 4-hydroxythreonine-4-phosphate dehydrogenase PdxA, partial [Nevskiales bacterium]|nr:4-hydroxythreonine-4-phosphate dehydrogenase PdxA [Nevskiales bacterium]